MGACLLLRFCYGTEKRCKGAVRQSLQGILFFMLEKSFKPLALLKVRYLSVLSMIGTSVSQNEQVKGSKLTS